jgi:hypothetical protein
MHKRSFTRRRRRRRMDEQSPELMPKPSSVQATHQPEQLGPHYNERPVHKLSTQDEEIMSGPKEHEEQGLASKNDPLNQTSNQADQEPGTRSFQEPIPAFEGRGEPEHAVAFNQRGPLRLRGRTDATYDGGQYHTENVIVRPGRDCTDCGRDCIHVTGTLVATYSISTTVTLPSVSDYPGLTPCQQTRVQNAITNILAPHEQQHVQAFRQYNGTTRRAFDLNLCRSEFNGAIQSMFAAEESARRAAAQAASDSLDPFHFDVDLNCEEPPSQRRGATSAAETPPEEEQSA